MVLGWRKAFCTTIPKDQQKQDHTNPSPGPSPKMSSKYKFFSSSSNPSTPRLRSQQPVSSPNTPTLRCKTAPLPASRAATTLTTTKIRSESPKLRCKTTNNSPRLFSFSNPSSPRSPSTFSFLKSSLLNSKTRCCICLQRMKSGDGTAIFTSECSHSFHFPCIAAHVQKEAALICPICNTTWKEMPFLSLHNADRNTNLPEPKSTESPKTIHVDINSKTKSIPLLKVYNDDEPLMSPTSGGRFNTILESDEENENFENIEFGGFFNKSANISHPGNDNNKVIDVKVSPEVALISVGRSSETYAIVLKLKGPGPVGKPVTGRAPIDLVTVLDVSGKMNDDHLYMMKKAMRIILSSLSPADRLSIVAFSTVSKRLLPLIRMTTAGRRSARRIVEAVVAIEGTSSSSTDALKKAAKVLEDRRDKNPATAIILLSDGECNHSKISSHLDVPVHSIALGYESACSHADSEDFMATSIRNIISVVVQDLSVKLGFISGSAPAEIAAVYSNTNRPQVFGSGLIRVGELYAEEERELLVELKVPSSSSSSRTRRVLAVRCSYKDPSSQEVINCREQALLVPRFHAVRSSAPDIQRLRSVFVTSRALAEACRLIERNELCGAHHMLASARALLLQCHPGSGSGVGSSDEFVRALEAELIELSKKKISQQRDGSGRGFNNSIVYLDEKAEPLTPTSAWRAAEKLAKLAVMNKSMNRISDLHGFENARF